MTTFYLFRESDSISIPFIGYNPELFRSFITKGGYFNKERQVFTFNNSIGIEHLSGAFSGAPYVLVDENAQCSPRVYDFITASASAQTEAAISFNQNIKFDELTDINYATAFPHQFSLAEKLSDYWLDKLEAELRSRKYSKCTMKAYIYYNKLICRILQKTPEEICSSDVTEFLAYMEKDNNYSASAMNLAISAIKFFFKFLLKKGDITDRHRPHEKGRLPMILSKEEIYKILGMEKNPKHRLLLMLAYSSGLRVSEVVALKKEHIDLSRQIIYIRHGKGRKDRSTLLSKKAAVFMEEYFSLFGIDKWIFPGQPSTRSLSIRSAQYIFDKALRRANIVKDISIHSLRHAFATHLLEGGTDIRYIQTLLGHANIRTTERYTHVAKRNVLSIKSPLDTF